MFVHSMDGKCEQEPMGQGNSERGPRSLDSHHPVSVLSNNVQGMNTLKNTRLKVEKYLQSEN